MRTGSLHVGRSAHEAGGAVATRPDDGAWPEDEWVPISALEHASYCPRQCALIHVEQSYEENVFTLRGNRAHQRAHDPGDQTSGDRRTVRGMPIWSAALGITGKADVVEYGGDGRPRPVEYKAGKHRRWRHEAVQLCAQGMCLEEMLGVAVPEGDIFYHASRERRAVSFDDELRATVIATIAEVREMMRSGRLPPAPNDQRCPNCSLIDICLPQISDQAHRVGGFRAALFQVDDGAISDEWD